MVTPRGMAVNGGAHGCGTVRHGPARSPTWATLTVDQTQHVAFYSGLYMLPEDVRGTVRARADTKLVRFYQRNQLVKVLPRAAPGKRSFDECDIPERKRAYALRDEGFSPPRRERTMR
jgi:hypothetical protein